jgi:hypothetical protein
MATPPPVRVGIRVHRFLRVGGSQPAVYCLGCAHLHRVQPPSTEEALWSAELPAGAECNECGIALEDLEPAGAEPSADWWSAVEDSVRGEAVRRVDASEGFTMEFAPSPEQHAQSYDEEERRIWRHVSGLSSRRGVN